jgi:hypothetical protein
VRADQTALDALTQKAQGLGTREDPHAIAKGFARSWAKRSGKGKVARMAFVLRVAAVADDPAPVPQVLGVGSLASLALGIEGDSIARFHGERKSKALILVAHACKTSANEKWGRVNKSENWVMRGDACHAVMRLVRRSGGSV